MADNKDSYIKTSDLISIFSAIAKKIDYVDKKIPDVPSLTVAMKKDGKTYGIMNGNYELIADPGEAVMVYTIPDANAIAIESLKAGSLMIDESTDPKIVEEVHELLGDELFNELSVNSVNTLELHPEPSKEELLRQAKEEYYARKAEQLAMAEAIEAAEAAQAGSPDVESPKKK